MNKSTIVLLVFTMTLFIAGCCVFNPSNCCDNGTKNSKELGVDCGGPCDEECPTCDDGILNQGETKIDCGGPCDACPTCDDGELNQGEEKVDCGGPCPVCPTCDDGILNQGEETVDCGGPCPQGPDGNCPIDGTPASSCDDGIRNGDEAGIDCGGAFCRPCTCYNGILDGNETNVDCGGDCAPCHCFNCIQDGNETDINCGGDCDKTCPTSIDERKELMITDLSVVESNEATNTNGSFHIQTLLERMAGPGQTAKDVMLSFLSTWRTDQSIPGVPGVTIPARPLIDSEVIDPWKTRDNQAGFSDAAWNMNFANAPFRLTAIVNRIDLHDRNADGSINNAGEGRFVFCVFDNKSGNLGAALPFNIIFEYELPANSEADLKEWAEKWHNLSNFNIGSPQYINALKAITDEFATCENLNQLRTNEIELTLGGSASPLWELRELNIDCNTGQFREVTRKMTPDDRFRAISNISQLRDFINQQEGNIVRDAHTIGNDLVAGNVFTPNPSFFWDVTGVNNKARHRLSLNTCNGCHGGEADIPAFTQIDVRQAGSEAQLHEFLTGRTGNSSANDGCISNPVDGTQGYFDDLRDRAIIMEKLTTPATAAVNIKVGTVLADRRNRTH